jgi:7,8-dihydropterin-6-yl-methyl-4-(beta-D-ribofuranosyl)aminobenzene 5'-phosphate synthase
MRWFLLFPAVLFIISSGAVSMAEEEMIITVVYDNNPSVEGLKTGWGFSCLVEGCQRTILFDTGGDSETLLYNMEKLGIDPTQVEVVLLSHIHGDHTGGLGGFLKRNSGVEVFLLPSFPSGFKREVKSLGANYIEVGKLTEVCKDVFSTGELGTGIREQSLVVKTSKGLVIITGCAHPGIVEIIEHVKRSFNEDIYLVMGGFHLVSTPEREIGEIIQDFRRLGVVKSAPCHCSGDDCRRLFERGYKEDFIKLGVGSRISIE